MTHTFALMEVSQSTYDEIAAKLKSVDYDHAFVDVGGAIAFDMHGVGLVPEPENPDRSR